MEPHIEEDPTGTSPGASRSSAPFSTIKHPKRLN